MTVYNITKSISKHSLKAIKKYLKVKNISLRYSDWLNEFGLYTKESYNQKKKDLCLKYLIKKYDLMNCKISILTDYPIILK